MTAGHTRSRKPRGAGLSGLRVARVIGLALSLLSPAPARSLSYEQASAGLPDTHRWDCNWVTAELCNNPGDTGGWVGIALADVNGDGADDVGAVGRLLYGFHVWLSDGAGSWTEASLGLDTGCHGRSDVAFTDVDGDGVLDFGGVKSINGGPGVWLGDGAGNWSESSAGLTSTSGEGFTFGDFDGDASPDLATVGHFSGGVRAFLGDGSGGWAEASAGLPGGGGHRMAAGDFDADGRDELVDTLFWSVPGGLERGVHIWRLETTGSWSLMAELRFDQPWGVASGDLDGDGLTDLAVSTAQDDVGTAGGVHVFLSDGAGGFVEVSTGLPADEVFFGDLALGDMDNDGDLDIVTGTWGGDVRLFLNHGAGGWSEALGTGLPRGLDNMEGIALGDVDRDCRLDVGYAAYTCGVQVYRQADPPPCPILARAGPPLEVCAGGDVLLDAEATRLCNCPPGEERFRWWADGAPARDWSPEPTLEASPAVTTLYSVDAACSTDLTCFVSDTQLVTVTPDPPPPALGNVLRLAKSPPSGVVFSWLDLAGTWGDYEIVALPEAFGPPTRANFEGPDGSVAASAPPGAEQATDGDGLGDPSGLVYFRIRGTSPCGGLPGPTS